MAISKGVNKRVAYKKETVWGTPAGASGAKVLRRVTSNFNLAKETYESQEIRQDYQVADMRHGIRSVAGSINGELSPGSYSDFFQSVVARDFTVVAPVSSLSVTIATAGSLYTVTRATGSWLTDGFRVGNVVLLSGAGLNVANANNNLLIVSMTATILTVRVLSGVALVAEGPIASVTATVPGKVTYAPLTGHTDDSYTVEEWYSDISQSEVFVGNKVGSVAVQLPTTGLVTTDITFQGRNLDTKGAVQYFTSPTAAGTTGIFAAVSGALVVNGTPTALITSADFTIERGLEAANVIGTNLSADIFTGRIRVNGNFSAYFQDGAFRDYFDSEATISLVVALTADSTKNSPVMSFIVPKIKLGSADKADGEMGIVSSHSFTALLNGVTSAGLNQTTIQIQDSTLV